MIRTLIFILLLLQSCLVLAQRSTSSPYSFFGLGTLQFNGTIENRSMGGMNTYSDSIHLNLLNPAGLHKLRYVTYTLGGITRTTNLRTVEEKQNVNNTTLEYLAIGVPLTKKSGLSFGLLPYSSVGYDLTSITDDAFTRNTGTGGVNRVFVNYGYRLFNNLSAGLSFNYNFGEIENSTLLLQNGIQFGTREDNLSELRGFNFRLGLLYEKTLKNEKIFYSSFTASPKVGLNANNRRSLAVVSVDANGQEFLFDLREIEVPNTEFKLPFEFNLGLGYGKKDVWFAGLEVGSFNSGSFTNRSFEIDNVRFEDALRLRLGGFYTPDNTSISSVLKRITYRTGFRYEETGLIVNDQSIDEFGISFGLGIPVSRTYFSNVNLGIEIGSRGKTSNGLIQENFINLQFGVSLNDRWFIKRMYN